MKTKINKNKFLAFIQNICNFVRSIVFWPTTINSYHGFTLIEVLIALAILGIGILSVATMQISSIKTNSSAINLSEGTNLGATIIEDLLRKSYTATELDPANNPHSDSTNYSGFTVIWNVVDNSPTEDTKSITTNITWEDNGVTKTAEFFCKKYNW